MHFIHDEPVSDVIPFESGIITICNRYKVKCWRRPSVQYALRKAPDSENKDKVAKEEKSEK